MAFNAHKLEFTSRRSLEQGDSAELGNVISIVEPASCDTLILCVPAMGVAAKQYKKLLYELAEQGFIAACYDLRGHGLSSIRASRANNFGYAALAEIDLPAAILTIKQRYPEQKLVLFGHSLGGQVCSLFLSQNPDQAEVLVLAASCSVHYKNWPSPYRWAVLLFAQASSIISSIVGYFPGRKLGFGGREARGVMHDWATNARTGDYRLSNSKHCYVPFPKLADLNVLTINFADDQLAPVLATDHLLAKIDSDRMTKTLITGNDIGRPTADHFNWLRSPKGVAKLVAEHLAVQPNQRDHG
ncbi:MAG: putative alpha/beta hydrolase [Arenicella sp.]|jgi:predicted alpha/beta hydrolase